MLGMLLHPHGERDWQFGHPSFRKNSSEPAVGKTYLLIAAKLLCYGAARLMDSIFCHGGDVRKPFIFWPGIIDSLIN